MVDRAVPARYFILAIAMELKQSADRPQANIDIHPTIKLSTPMGSQMTYPKSRTTRSVDDHEIIEQSFEFAL